MNLWQYRILHGSSRIIFLILLMATNGSMDVSAQIIPEKLDFPTLGDSSPSSSMISEISSQASSSRCLLQVAIKFTLMTPTLFYPLLLFLIHYLSLQLWWTRKNWQFVPHQVTSHNLKIFLLIHLNC